MERRLKERLTGAVVLMLLAIIFIPMILDNSAQDDVGISETNIPPAPVVEFRSAIVPVGEIPPVSLPQMPVEPLPTGVDLPADVPTMENPVPVEGVTPLPESTEHPDSSTDSSAPTPETAPPQITGATTDPASATSMAPATDTSSRSLSAWVIQLGSFSSQVNAEGLVRRLQSNGFPAYIETVQSGADTVYKVRVGPELSRTEAETVQKNLKSRMNLDAIILRFP